MILIHHRGDGIYLESGWMNRVFYSRRSWSMILIHYRTFSSSSSYMFL